MGGLEHAQLLRNILSSADATSAIDVLAGCVIVKTGPFKHLLTFADGIVINIQPYTRQSLIGIAQRCVSLERPFMVPVPAASEVEDAIEAKLPTFTWDKVLGVSDLCGSDKDIVEFGDDGMTEGDVLQYLCLQVLRFVHRESSRWGFGVQPHHFGLCSQTLGGSGQL